MGQPAARITDLHTCPMVTGVVPHVGGPIITGLPTVLTGNQPQARVSDFATCVGPIDVIVKGSPTVLVGGLPAARIGDMTVHGGVIVTGLPTVLIGDGGAAGGGAPGGAAGAKPPNIQEIEKRLDEASWLKRDDVARDIVNSMSPEQIKNLPTATRNRLMKEMIEGYLSDDDKAALKKIYAVKFVDPEFEKIDAQHRGAMLVKLRTDPDLVNAKSNWASMSKADRFKTMQKVADYQADAYGIPKTTLAEFDEPPKGGYITNGYYQHSDGKLYVNTNSASSSANFDDALDVVTHENGHRYQNGLIDDLNGGKIKPGDPLYDQAETFRLNDKYYTNDKPEYFTQPMETHSRTTGDAAAQAIP